MLPLVKNCMNSDYTIYLKNGEKIDFKAFYNAYYNALILFARKYVNHPEDGESLVQETFLSLWEQRKMLEDEASLKSYLYTTLRNKALNHIRHERIQRRYAEMVIKERESDEYYTESVVEEESFRIVIQAVDRLPEKARDICLLMLDGKDNNEIAAALDMSVHSVKYHKKIAYKLLREQLSGHHPSMILLNLFWKE